MEVIEIHFGARDSELKGWEYTIPEGYTAEIKDGKIIVKEKEPMEIRYAGKVYKVHDIREFPCGRHGYIIEDEPGHYDCILNPDEVLGGGYGIKSNGSPYPTKEANFGQPRWKPSEEQMEALKGELENKDYYIPYRRGLMSLYEDLKKL